MELTIQILTDGIWHDAAILTITHPDKGHASRSYIGYQLDYAMQWRDHADEHACSMRLPVLLMNEHESPHWFRFLDDIMPSGAARRFWISHLGLQQTSIAEQDCLLLQQGTIAPVGNMRIKESVPVPIAGTQLHLRRYGISDVVERHTDFLEYAQQMGAISGGATGAGGEAPKLLLRCSTNEEVWIDTFQDDPTIPDHYYLVKFPRGQRTSDDCDILRTEFHYYHELAAMGVDTIPLPEMRLIEGNRYPSLWLPRFDVCWQGKQWHRYALESVYSLLDKPPGSSLNHFEVLRQLTSILLRHDTNFDQARFVVEWARRDFLNIMFGNSDNHGRNSALLKKPGNIWLAPVYDFAPMKADPEGITRRTTWGTPFEEGGEYQWEQIAHALSDLCDPLAIMHALKTTAQQLSGLKERLHARGVPDRILNMPVMGFDFLETKLTRWKLL